MNGEKNVYLHKKEDLEMRAKEGEKKRKGKQRDVYGQSVTCKQGAHEHQQDPYLPPPNFAIRRQHATLAAHNRRQQPTPFSPNQKERKAAVRHNERNANACVSRETAKRVNTSVQRDFEQ